MPRWLIAVFGVVLLTPHLLFDEAWSRPLAALTLSAIASVYFGFAIIDGRPKALLVETVGVSLYGATALIGLLIAPIWLGIGILAHAVWDLFHHNSGFGAATPSWYIPFCVWVDLIVGGGLLVLYLR